MAISPDLIVRKFRIKSLLGRGGMGEVYLALDETLGARRVALKLLRIDDEETRRRFAQEARAAASLQHPHIITIYEYGEHEGCPYIAMEYVNGVTLSAVIAEKRPLSLATRLELVEQASAALAHAHGQGIVHRDVKPSNLIVDHEGRLKVLDFGIAHVPAANLTRGPAMLGTPNYMSPEQINGEPVDRRSDVFALGLVLYELLAFRKAFPGDSARVLDRIRFEAPAPLTFTPKKDLPPGIFDVVERAIAKKPEQRFQNMLELHAALRQVRGSAAASWSDVQTNTVALKATGRTPPSSPALAERRRALAERHVKIGREAFGRRDYAVAVVEFEQALELDESHPDAARLLEEARGMMDQERRERVDRLVAEAERKFARGDLGDAREILGAAQALAPLDAHVLELAETLALAQAEVELQANLERAQAALTAGELSRCAALLDAASELQPEAPGVIELRRQLDEAYAARARARRLQALVDQARAHLDAGEPERARLCVESALSEDPHLAPAVDIRARIRERLQPLPPAMVATPPLEQTAEAEVVSDEAAVSAPPVEFSQTVTPTDPASPPNDENDTQSFVWTPEALRAATLGAGAIGQEPELAAAGSRWPLAGLGGKKWGLIVAAVALAGVALRSCT